MSKRYSGKSFKDSAQEEEEEKIFAKIEWEDTSKNPTAGSKNNSLS